MKLEEAIRFLEQIKDECKIKIAGISSEETIEIILKELKNRIPRQKIEDKITYWNKRLNDDVRLDWILRDKCIINVLQELLEEK